MESKQAFGAALQRLRRVKKLSQEDFSNVSSRTYLSTLERGLKTPTLGKVEELAEVMGIHPLSLLVEYYSIRDDSPDLEQLFECVRRELPTHV
ncbi:helix-turn-helix transcriptional regulator [Halomonas sp. Bachu 37]|uniref:helix-turn-helix domain-containing protein n=1 Tax=Halomonas kashgarensis TaxID=3084920 RepID=UPI003217C1C7